MNLMQNVLVLSYVLVNVYINLNSHKIVNLQKERTLQF